VSCLAVNWSGWAVAKTVGRGTVEKGRREKRPFPRPKFGQDGTDPSRSRPDPESPAPDDSRDELAGMSLADLLPTNKQDRTPRRSSDDDPMPRDRSSRS
jgi:hypothetical protein